MKRHKGERWIEAGHLWVVDGMVVRDLGRVGGREPLNAPAHTAMLDGRIVKARRTEQPRPWYGASGLSFKIGVVSQSG